jgi:hypothetical protein
MSTTLTDEIAAIMADVTGWSGESLVGRRYLAQGGTPPRVVWVPLRGTPQPAMKVAGATRSIATRRLTLALSIWQTTPDTLSDTIDAIMAAVHRRWHGRWGYAGEDWTDEAAQTDLGEQATLTLTVDLAVFDNAAVTATLTAAEFNTDPAVADDGVMHVGEQE